MLWVFCEGRWVSWVFGEGWWVCCGCIMRGGGCVVGVL